MYLTMTMTMTLMTSIYIIFTIFNSYDIYDYDIRHMIQLQLQIRELQGMAWWTESQRQGLKIDLTWRLLRWGSFGNCDNIKSSNRIMLIFWSWIRVTKLQVKGPVHGVCRKRRRSCWEATLPCDFMGHGCHQMPRWRAAVFQRHRLCVRHCLGSWWHVIVGTHCC